MRPQMWQLCSGAYYKQFQYPSDYYESLLERNQEKSSVATEEIERDLHRSLPDHPFFGSKGKGIQSLRRVLTAYAWRNRRVGYCQSTNIIAALLLIYLQMDEQAVFWLLATIIEDIVPGYYDVSMVGSIVDQNVLEELIELYLPRIKKHFAHLKLPVGLLTLPWLLCLFISYLDNDDKKQEPIEEKEKEEKEEEKEEEEKDEKKKKKKKN